VREVRTEIVLEAPPESVWAVLTDLDAYAEWNPQTVRASGVVSVGSMPPHERSTSAIAASMSRSIRASE